jgi:ferredoxin
MDSVGDKLMALSENGKGILENRRDFLKKGAMAAAVLAMPAVSGCVDMRPIRGNVPMKSVRTGRALVLWFSQTGYTERNGRLLAHRLGKLGMNVTASEMRSFDRQRMRDFDLIVIGSPVFYYDTPAYVKAWIKTLPELKGTPVAAYVTFGGPEGNQHNAACSILGLLAEREGVPVGANAFMNMSSFPLAWSDEEVHEKTWMSRHLPNEETYGRVREYAGYLVNQVNQAKDATFSKRLTVREVSTWFGPIWWTKKFVKNHSIVEDDCIGCGTCVEKCPAGAINLSAFRVDRDACVLCFGCVNNCPAQAVHMEYSGERVIGYRDFMNKNNLIITEPEELSV